MNFQNKYKRSYFTPIKILSYIVLFLTAISFIVFFIVLSANITKLTYENALLSFLSLIISTGLTSLYSLITKTEYFSPTTNNGYTKIENFKDSLNLLTVVINLIYTLIVYIASKYSNMALDVSWIMFYVLSILAFITLLIGIIKLKIDEHKIKSGKYSYVIEIKGNKGQIKIKKNE